MKIVIHLLYCLAILSTRGECYYQAENPKKIVIFGAGYIGTVLGACFASCGHSITFIEPNQTKVDIIRRGKSPIAEHNLEELIHLGIERGLITAKCEVENEIQDAHIIMIAVQTPTTEDGRQELTYLENALNIISELAQKRTKPLVVSIQSTILPSAFRYLEKLNPSILLVMNPEFIRESTAVRDFFNPSFTVVGGDNDEAVQTVLSLYADISPKRFAVKPETACMIKYACNAFHAAKIAFANEIAAMCDTLEVSPVDLMDIFCEDKKLNCSAAYLKPGFAFGGPCLVKDLKALVSYGHELGDTLPLLSAIIPSNQMRFQTILNEILKGNHQKLAIMGMTFKKNSDDIRQSPYVQLIDELYAKDISLQIFDPDVKLENNPYLPLIKPDFATALMGCDGVVLCKDLLSKYQIEELRKANIPIYDLGYFFY